MSEIWNVDISFAEQASLCSLNLKMTSMEMTAFAEGLRTPSKNEWVHIPVTQRHNRYLLRRDCIVAIEFSEEEVQNEQKDIDHVG